MLRMVDNTIQQRRLQQPVGGSVLEQMPLETYVELLDRLSALAWILPANAPALLKNCSDEASRQRQILHDTLLNPLPEESVEALLEMVQRLRSEVHFFQAQQEAIRQYITSSSTLWRAFSLNTMVESTLKLLQPLWETRHITLHHHTTPEMPLLKANPHRLQQALIALLLNATQAMEGERRELTLSTMGVLDRQGRTAGVQMSIQDTGSGILATEIETIHQPLYTTRPLPDSLGMGLTLAEKFVQEAHGRLELFSTPGEGTCVNLFLPTIHISELPDENTPTHEAFERARSFLRLVA